MMLKPMKLPAEDLFCNPALSWDCSYCGIAITVNLSPLTWKKVNPHHSHGIRFGLDNVVTHMSL